MEFKALAVPHSASWVEITRRALVDCRAILDAAGVPDEHTRLVMKRDRNTGFHETAATVPEPEGFNARIAEPTALLPLNDLDSCARSAGLLALRWSVTHG